MGRKPFEFWRLLGRLVLNRGVVIARLRRRAKRFQMFMAVALLGSGPEDDAV